MNSREIKRELQGMFPDGYTVEEAYQAGMKAMQKQAVAIAKEFNDDSGCMECCDTLYILRAIELIDIGASNEH